MYVKIRMGVKTGTYSMAFRVLNEREIGRLLILIEPVNSNVRYGMYMFESSGN